MTNAAAVSGRAILVVDDDLDLRTSVGELLRDEGFSVIEAPNGRVALDHLRSVTVLPALILLDLSMPVMSGWEVIRVLQGDPRLADIPVALVTAERSFPQAVADAIVGELHKPYAVDDLLALVRRYARAEPPVAA